MYLKYFNLTEQPFNMTPDPRFFYFSKKHEDALSNLLFGISERKGFITITGEIGTGKTTLCRLLLNRLDKKVKTSLIFNPNLTTIELLQAINQDFGIESKSISKKELIDALNTFLLGVLKKGDNAALIIDEAQNLTPECLEEVRMLSNLETERDKLLQIILVGQPELRKKLELERLKQLNQRIALRYHLEPFDPKDTKAYILHRLKIAGGDDKVFFTQQAFDKIYEYSEGTPRLINLLCDKILLAAFVADTKTVSHQVAASAIKELRGDNFPSEKKIPIFNSSNLSKKDIIPRSLSITALLLFILLVFFIVGYQKGIIGALVKENNIAPKNTLARNDSSEYDRDNILRIKKSEDSKTASLMTLLKVWRIEFLKDEILLKKDRGEKEFKNIIKNFGFEIYNIKDLNQIKILGYPLLVNIKKNGVEYYVVLRQMDDKDVIILDPMEGKRVYSIKEFEAIWKGEGIIFWKRLDGINIPISTVKPNSEVMGLQEVLRNRNIYNGRIDGYYGSMTKESVSEFQIKSGLKSTGDFDAETHMFLSKNVKGDAVPALK
ncbi:MAG: AAA family ATPase [Nitrospirae bacterium]|nr:AAA family ATPase [Nitrospirota bacterium]